MQNRNTFWIPDITDWWCQQEETNSKYANHFHSAWVIVSIVPHGVVVEAGCSPAEDIIWFRQSKTTGETLHENVIVSRFVGANEGTLAGDNPSLDTTEPEDDLELIRYAEDWKLHRIAKAQDLLEI